MQISATLIAAQQAARDARDRLQMTQFAPAADFSAALEKESGFTALPLKQVAPPVAAPAQDTGTGSRPGSVLDIRV